MLKNSTFLPQEIVGESQFSQKHTLIADLKGLLVELKPMRLEDWQELQEEVDKNGHPVSQGFFGYDMFDDTAPNLDQRKYRDKIEDQGKLARERALLLSDGAAVEGEFQHTKLDKGELKSRKSKLFM